MGNQVDRRELRGAAFGRGVWQSAGRNRAVRIVGGLILAFGSLGLLWPFAPMHQREVLAAGGGTLSDTMHVVLGVVTGAARVRRDDLSGGSAPADQSAHTVDWAVGAHQHQRVPAVGCGAGDCAAARPEVFGHA